MASNMRHRGVRRVNITAGAALTVDACMQGRIHQISVTLSLRSVPAAMVARHMQRCLALQNRVLRPSPKRVERHWVSREHAFCLDLSALQFGRVHGMHDLAAGSVHIALALHMHLRCTGRSRDCACHLFCMQVVNRRS